MPTLVDSYTSGGSTYQVDANQIHRVSQSFTGTNGPITSAEFYVETQGSPTGNVVLYLYGHTGTFGTSSEPGSLLATSDARDITTLSAIGAWEAFTFSGAEQYSLQSGTKYCIVLHYAGGNTSNRLLVSYDPTSPTHDGNAATSTDDVTYTTYSGSDGMFKVYNEPTSTFVPKIQVL